MKIIVIMLCAMLLAGCAPAPSGSADPHGPEAVEEEGQEDGRKSSGQDDLDVMEPADGEPAAPEEPEPRAEDAGDMIFTEEECENAIGRLLDSEPVHPANAELLKEMGQIVTVSKVIGAYGEIFSKMDNEKRARLRYQILSDVMWGGPEFENAIDIEPAEGRYEADGIADLEDAEALFRDVYGEEHFTPAAYERAENGKLLLSFADGDPWVLAEHVQFFEDDLFYLLSGPAFYEDNSGATEYEGYVDILLARNPDSRFGVTLLYGRYRDVIVPVVSVETSTEQPPSGNKTYSGANLVDGDPETVWAEGVPGTGVGETVTLHLDKKRPVFGVLITNGYTAGYDLYEKNGMLTAVSVDFGGETVEAEIPEGYGYEGYSPEDLAECNRSRVELDEPVVTDTVTITITGARKGTKYDDTCVSELIVY